MPTPVTQGTPRTGGGGTPSSTPRLIRPPSLTLGTRPQDLKHRPVGTPMSGPRPGAAGSQAGTPSSQHRAIGQHQQQMQQQHAAQQPPGPSIHQRLAKMFGDERRSIFLCCWPRLQLRLSSDHRQLISLKRGRRIGSRSRSRPVSPKRSTLHSTDSSPRRTTSPTSFTLINSPACSTRSSSSSVLTPRPLWRRHARRGRRRIGS